MALVPRKAITAALLALLAPAGGPFPTAGRRLADPEQISGGQFPAIYLVKPNEKVEYDGELSPPKYVLDFLAVIYTDYTGNAAAVPADGIDDLIDQVTAALAPSGADVMSGRQTLGGLVYNVEVVDEIKIAPGDYLGKGTTEIPIRVWRKEYP